MDTDKANAARTPQALECGDLSPLFRLADSSAKQRRAEGRAEVSTTGISLPAVA